MGYIERRYSTAYKIGVKKMLLSFTSKDIKALAAYVLEEAENDPQAARDALSDADWCASYLKDTFGIHDLDLDTVEGQAQDALDTLLVEGAYALLEDL